jgi:hypothetical protein
VVGVFGKDRNRLSIAGTRFGAGILQTRSSHFARRSASEALEERWRAAVDIVVYNASMDSWRNVKQPSGVPQGPRGADIIRRMAAVVAGPPASRRWEHDPNLPARVNLDRLTGIGQLNHVQ